MAGKDTDVVSQSRAEKRLERNTSTTLQYWKPADNRGDQQLPENVTIDCGWGRLFFAHTFTDKAKLVQAFRDEEKAARDIAFYVREPQVLLAEAPQELFLDPSHTYRLWFNNYRAKSSQPKAFLVRRIKKKFDTERIRQIYLRCGSVPASNEFLLKVRNSKKIIPLVAEEINSGKVLGVILGVDHVEVFNDPEQGGSFWGLAVEPQSPLPGIGEALIRYLCEYFIARGRNFLDLSVMHDNVQAIRLYEKLGFERVPVFSVKRKNPINEPLYTAYEETEGLNSYAMIIVSEAKKRGIRVKVVDRRKGYFSLTFGGRSVVCWESLSEYTTAVAMTICDDKALTRRILHEHELRVPIQRPAGDDEENEAFLSVHQKVVVKPVRGEQGAGVAVDLTGTEELHRAVQNAKKVCSDVLLEEMIDGVDLRMVVINFKLVAAAVRKPPVVVGDGQHTVRQLIEKQSRRRAAATGGESRIPLDSETKRCIQHGGYDLESILPVNESLQVRKTANLHTGGTIHDVTEEVHPTLIKAAETAARAINIPVTGLDFIVPDHREEQYVIIEANERPGLDNHQPQPTAERFIDMLFPETIA